MKARVVDKEIAVDVTVEIEGDLEKDAPRTLVDRAIEKIIQTQPQHDICIMDWDLQYVSRDTTRNGRRLIRVDWNDNRSMPLYVTVTE
ncbi:MAG: hypothetical protein NTW87_11585 [Planctomycetota bacterium]|nr:hypothetical protein [Planctomycetota bacterium]